MNTGDGSVKRLPRVMSASRVAKEVLGIDRAEVYRLAREGRLAGAFRIGKLWYVNVRLMIAEMQKHPL